MSDDQGPGAEFDRLLDDIREDWRRLDAAKDDLTRRRIRKDMQALFETLRRRLEEDPPP
jgi:hypothetical protein